MVPSPWAGSRDHLGDKDGELSGDGRIVVFRSEHLVPPGALDQSHRDDLVIYDRKTGDMEVPTANNQDNIGSVRISDDGRYVAYDRILEKGVIELLDRLKGTTTRVSMAKNGRRVNGDSSLTGISADGRLVSFWANASNLVARDTNKWIDSFVRDMIRGATIRVSLS